MNHILEYPTVSGDGRFVGFASDLATVIAGDTNNVMDVFLFDRLTGRVELVSLSSTGSQGNGLSTQPLALSRDARFAAFASVASNLVPGDLNAVGDVFVRDRVAGTTTRVSVGPGGIEGNGSAYQPALSADGRFVVFESLASNLVPGDTNAAPDVFVHDRQTGTTARASTSSAGVQGNGQSIANFRLSISGDGRYVGFYSDASNLVTGDANSRGDAFVKDMLTGALERVDLTTSGAEANAGSRGAMLSDDGRYVAFETDATNLPGGQGVFITPR